MLAASLQGLILGLILSIPVSPIFFLLMSTSIEKGFKNAIVLEIGIIASDILCIMLIYFGLANFIAKPSFQIPVYIFGGIFLIIFGLVNLFKKHIAERAYIQVNSKNFLETFFRGFALNISNPAVAIFWLGAVSIALAQFKVIKYAVAIYFVSAVFTVLFFDVLKIWLADFIRKWLKQRQIVIIGKLSGAAMGIFGMFLCIKGLILYFY